MLTAVCPHCSGSIQVPSTPTEVFVFPHCRTKLKLLYTPAPSAAQRLVSKARSACGKAASSVQQFVKSHPKATVALTAAGGFLLYCLAQSDSSPSAQPADSRPLAPSSCPPDQTSVSASHFESEAEAENEEEIPVPYVGLCGYCYNCGSPLAGGFYTDPWEDGDNEYGYWNCPCCNAINVDWDSGDD